MKKATTSRNDRLLLINLGNAIACLCCLLKMKRINHHQLTIDLLTMLQVFTVVESTLICFKSDRLR
ncbi:MAG: hypothetical protein AAF383_13005 [Cyanobacteria bacterium P01_A01_bin.83]